MTDEVLTMTEVAGEQRAFKIREEKRITRAGLDRPIDEPRLVKLRDVLLPALLSGELSVAQAEQAVEATA